MRFRYISLFIFGVLGIILEMAPINLVSSRFRDAGFCFYVLISGIEFLSASVPQTVFKTINSVFGNIGGSKEATLVGSYSDHNINHRTNCQISSSSLN